MALRRVVGHGIAHGSLPQDSLNFRWRYWAASTRLIRQHPLLGVGWGNFGEPYLAVRWPIAAEEIRDPHNFIVRAFAELGFVGGILALLWLARSAWEITQPIVPEAVASAKRRVLIIAIAAIVLGVALNMGLSIDFSQPPAYLFLEVFRRVLALGLLTIGVLATTVRIGAADALDTAPAPWMLYGLLIGLGAFFVHNLMEFVLAEPGPLTLFSVLLGAAIGLRTRWPAPAVNRPNRVPIGILVAASLAWLAVIATLVIPITAAEEHARDGGDQIRAGRPDLAVGLITDALRTVPYNVDYAYRAARAMRIAGEKPERVAGGTGTGDRRRPEECSILSSTRERGIAPGKPRREHHPLGLSACVGDRSAKPGPRLEYADHLAKLGQPLAAAEQYQLALATNARYDPHEPKRLPVDRVKQIEQLIQQLKSAGNPASKP